MKALKLILRYGLFAPLFTILRIFPLGVIDLCEWSGAVSGDKLGSSIADDLRRIWSTRR